MSLHPTPRDGREIRTADPSELATRVIDTGVADEPTNRVTNTLVELDDDIALVESFSHMVVLRTDAGLVSFDASGSDSGAAVVGALRNIWRMYDGWWNGDPSMLKPAPQGAVAAELATLIGGVEPLVARAVQLAEDGDLRLACNLIEIAAAAAPDDVAVHGARADIYLQRRAEEASLMSKGIFAAAGRESQAVVDAATGDNSPST